MRNRRRVFAGLGVLAFLAAVVLTQMSADESKWSNFGNSVGLSIGLAVFLWFMTEGLRDDVKQVRDDIKQVLGNQDELANHVDELMKTIGETEGTEPGRVDRIVGLLNKMEDRLNEMTNRLTTIDNETLGILDGVLTALDVQLKETVGSRKVRPGNRWSIDPPSRKPAADSIKAAAEKGPSPSLWQSLEADVKSVWGKQGGLHSSLNSLL